MESGEECDALKKQNEDLKLKLQEYKSLEEDLMANRVFEKAKRQFSVYFTLGGIIIALSAVLGIKALTDYTKTLAKEKIEAITEDQMRKALQAEGERQILKFVKAKQTEFVGFAQQQIQRIALAGQPIASGQFQSAESLVAAVDSIDYSDRMPPVRDQGQEGASVGFAVAAALEFQIQKTLGRKVTISPRQIYNVTRLKNGTLATDSGAVLRDALDVLLQTGGVPESVWPYKAGLDVAAKPPKGIDQAEHFKISRLQPVRNVKELKATLQTIGPIVGVITVYESILGAEVAKTGRVAMPSPSESALGAHAVCFVGFDDSKQLLKFRNQWGKSWGENGYAYVPYEYADKFLNDAWAISIK